MKRIILLQLFILCVVSLSARDFKYYDLRSVKNDTTAYLYKNFIEQKSYFVDKPLSEFLKYYEKDFCVGTVGIGSTSPYIHPQGKSFICYIRFFWIESDSWDYIFDNFRDQLTFIRLTFKAPYTTDEDDFYKKLPENSTDRDEAMMLKDYIVSDIVIKGKFAKK